MSFILGSTVIQSAVLDASIGNTTTETAIFVQPVPANVMAIGRVLTFQCWGIYSAAALAPTITMRLRWGTSVASSVVLCSAVASALVNSATNLGFNAKTLSTIRAIGSGGSVFTQGKLEYETATGVGAAWVKSQAAIAADLSSDASLIATVQFSGANVSNTVRASNALLSIE